MARRPFWLLPFPVTRLGKLVYTLAPFSTGPAARGGALDYIQHGLMIRGFGLVAWPAEYRVSGIKTFLVNQDGVIYEKDLGVDTSAAAEAITALDPDKTWQRVR